MAYIEAQVNALLAAIDAQDDIVTAALTNARTVRPLYFPEYASAVPTINLASIRDPQYQQTVEPGSALDTALTGLKTALDTAITGWAAVLTLRTAVSGYTDTADMTALLTGIDAQDDGITAALANIRTARPLVHSDYASAVPAANLLSVHTPEYQLTVEPGTVLDSALTGLRSGLDSAITGFASILTLRAAVTPP
jgi:hypothetical protein